MPKAGPTFSSFYFADFHKCPSVCWLECGLSSVGFSGVSHVQCVVTTGFTMSKAGPTLRAFSGPTKVRNLEQHVWRREAWGVHESHQDIGRLQVAVHPLHLLGMREARCHLTSYPHTCHLGERPPPSPQEPLEVKVGCLEHRCRLPFISSQMHQLHKVRVLQGTKGCRFLCAVGLQEFSSKPLA